MTTMTETTMRHTLTTPTDRTIRIERIFKASRDRVWQALTDPALEVDIAPLTRACAG